MSGSEPKRRAAGELEGEVLAALWATSTPLTPEQVRQELGGELAYTTVMTILSRLAEKGLASRLSQGRGYAYVPTEDQADHAARRMRELLDEGDDQSAVLQRFVETLGADEEALLQQLLKADAKHAKRKHNH